MSSIPDRPVPNTTTINGMDKWDLARVEYERYYTRYIFEYEEYKRRNVVRDTVICPACYRVMKAKDTMGDARCHDLYKCSHIFCGGTVYKIGAPFYLGDPPTNDIHRNTFEERGVPWDHDAIVNNYLDSEGRRVTEYFQYTADDQKAREAAKKQADQSFKRNAADPQPQESDRYDRRYRRVSKQEKVELSENDWADELYKRARGEGDIS